MILVGSLGEAGIVGAAVPIVAVVVIDYCFAATAAEEPATPAKKSAAMTKEGRETIEGNFSRDYASRGLKSVVEKTGEASAGRRRRRGGIT